MGLARVALPFANSTPFTWLGSFASLNAGPPVQTASGAVEPPYSSRGVFKNGLDPIGHIYRTNFNFHFAVSSDYITNLTFTLRVSTANDSSLTLTVRSAAGNDSDIIDQAISGGPTIYTIVTDINPIVSRAWDPDDLSGVSIFGFRNTNSGDISDFIDVTNFYVTTNCTVGATTGRSRVMDNWRFCDVCGRKVTYASIRRPVAPHPQAGLSVCGRCHDELDHETRKAMSGKIPMERPTDLY